jgi:serine/threonine-protein kinase
LPFRNGGAGDDEHIADGLTDDLIDLLSTIGSLRVTSRGVVMRHKGKEHDPREVGRALGVQVVVEGSVRRTPGAIRIQARLVSVDDGFQIWSKRLDGDEGDLLALSERVARAVARALDVDLQGGERGATHDPRTIDLYMRARKLHVAYFDRAHMDAAALYAETLALSPDDPRMLAGYVSTRAPSVSSDEEVRQLREAAERALSLAPSMPDAHVALGVLLLHCNDPAGAIPPLRRALLLQSNHAEAHDVLGRVLLEADMDEGVRHTEAAMALEPDLGLPRTYLARHHWLRGDRARGEALLDEIPSPSNRAGAHGRFVLWHRDSKAARALAEAFVPATAFDAGVMKFIKLAAEGTYLAESEFASLRITRRGRSFLAQIDTEAACFLGEVDRALRSLAHADALGLSDLAWLDHCPALAEVRGHAELASLRERVAGRVARVRAAYEAG